jgi:outer membrane immunogenic protein
MNRYFGWAFASVVSLGMGGLGVASAADMAVKAPVYKAPPPVLVYDWSGFYIGLNGGGGSTRKCWDLAALSAPFGAINPAPAGLVNPNIPEGCHDATGGTVGGQIGYRWQSAAWVFGLEAQGNWADFKGSNLNSLAGGLFVAGLTDQSKMDAFGLFTGQVGYAWNNVLLYVKGGGAVVADRYNTFIAPLGTPIDSASETRWGGTVGAGLEYGFAPNWSVAVEYDHLFMGSENVTANTPAGLFSATDRIHQDVDIGTVRVNYRFGGPVVAKY